MSKYLREIVENEKKHYINLLLNSGALNIHDRPLEQLTLTQLKTEYKRISYMKKIPDK